MVRERRKREEEETGVLGTLSVKMHDLSAVSPGISKWGEINWTSQSNQHMLKVD